jgi:hypothetical protein
MKFRTPDKAPPYIKTEVLENPGIEGNIWDNWTVERQARVAATIPWIYSNVFRIAQEVASADITIVDKDSGETVESELKSLLDKPNEFFDTITLLEYTIWGLYLGRYGAFWYLAPDKNDPTKIREIWPIPIDRITPIRNKTSFISGYRYKSHKTGKSIIINPNNIARFFFSHPWDMWENFTPLYASTLSMSVYEGINTNTRDLFLKGRGVPLAIVSVSPDVTREDFAVIRQQLREDWESERRIAIAKAGDINVATVGINNRDLEIVAISNFNKDTIDATFMGGIPWRSDQFKSGEGLREANKQVKEIVIHPTHKRIASLAYLQVVAPYFNDQHTIEFQDVRAQDRSIQVQERTIYWRAKTLDEARRDLGDPPIEIPSESPIPQYFGSLPVSLANNSSFVMAISGLMMSPGGQTGMGPGNRSQGEELKDPVGNLPGALDVTAQVNQLAEDKSFDMSSAAALGMKEEIRKWRKVAIAEWKKKGTPEAVVSREFKSDIIIDIVKDSIIKELPMISSEDDINEVFKMWLE